ncbi:MAG TPA: DUF2244 domain-containing protein [Rubrivivax sp.]|nr:DUF2244 domain-containing protein [Rubrivivax sp.]
MTATFAPRPWALPPGHPRSLPWVFGSEVVLEARPGAPRALQWLLKRNCSITPRQLGAVYLSLCVVSLLIGAFFYAQGAPLVLAFTALELTLVGTALLVFARHAGDFESLTLVGRSLQVQQSYGSRVEQTDFTADWLTVEPAAGQGSLVQLSGRGQTVRVGRFVRPELRAAFARELRLALRQAPPRAPPESEPK